MKTNPFTKWLRWNLTGFGLMGLGYLDSYLWGNGTTQPFFFFVPALFIFIYVGFVLHPRMERYLLGLSKRHNP